MSVQDRWFGDGQPRAPSAYAGAAARGYREDPFIRTEGDLEEGAGALAVEPELAHALVLVLSELDGRERLPFADCFYAERGRDTASETPLGVGARVAAAAAIVLLVVDLTESPDLLGMRVLDALDGAAQGDDSSALSEPALQELRKAVARVRLDVDLEDESDPRAAASIAVVETIDPASGAVDLQEILCRAAWASLQSGGRARALAVLLAADRILQDAGE